MYEDFQTTSLDQIKASNDDLNWFVYKSSMGQTEYNL